LHKGWGRRGNLGFPTQMKDTTHPLLKTHKGWGRRGNLGFPTQMKDTTHPLLKTHKGWGRRGNLGFPTPWFPYSGGSFISFRKIRWPLVECQTNIQLIYKAGNF
jgi:hypothetical protein